MLALITKSPLVVHRIWESGPVEFQLPNGDICYPDKIGKVSFCSTPAQGNKKAVYDDTSIAVVPADVVGEAPTPYHERVEPDTYSFDGTNLLVTKNFRAPPLLNVQRALCAIVDQDAEIRREAYITKGSGQALTYEAKKAEVNKWMLGGGGSAAASDYPWAASRAKRLSTTVELVLAEWKQKIAGWEQAGIAIEYIRETGKDAINAATSVEAAWAAFQTVVWPPG